ncbi:hypothetical protein PoB_007433700 [Plakobranchus ocellatus]|uniref:Uncharacterized protein n=1 Tax=Plakobranchus ocellatus TaxID=259542 RepID=A0AAV4DU16_9GAST|nr:hypothetical protein PoB_007433700 [Plakobranchus ocellatus]
MDRKELLSVSIKDSNEQVASQLWDVRHRVRSPQAKPRTARHPHFCSSAVVLNGLANTDVQLSLNHLNS